MSAGDDTPYRRNALVSQEIVTAALDALEAETGIRGQATFLPTPDSSAPEGRLVLHSTGQLVDKASYTFQVRQPNLAGLVLLRASASNTPHEAQLLITSQLSPEQFQRCVQNKVQCLDAAGNAYLTGKGYLIKSSGKRLPKDDPLLRMNAPPVSLATVSGLRVLYVLLTLNRTTNRRLDITYREIADRAGVALGTVSRVVDEMAQQGFITRENGRLRRLLSVNRLTDLWLASYPQKLRPRLNPLRFSGSLPEKWWEQTDLRPYDALWGGETAYWLLQHGLPPQQHIIYASPEKRASLTRELAGKFLLRPDPAGAIEILDRFWLPYDEAWSSLKDPISENLWRPYVSDMLICADLMTVPDARAQGAATDLLWRLHAND